MQENIKYSLEKEKLGKYFSLLTGISLLIFLLILILILVFANTPLAVQQVLMAIMGMIILVAVDAFRQCLEDKNPIDIINIIDNSQYNNTVNTYYEKQNLVDAAKEIQELLDQLSKAHPPKTEDDKVAIATEAFQEINHNPTLQSKVIKAVQTVGVQAFIETVNNPLALLVVSGVLTGFLRHRNTEDKNNES